MFHGYLPPGYFFFLCINDTTFKENPLAYGEVLSTYPPGQVSKPSIVYGISSFWLQVLSLKLRYHPYFFGAPHTGKVLSFEDNELFTFARTIPIILLTDVTHRPEGLSCATRSCKEPSGRFA